MKKTILNLFLLFLTLSYLACDSGELTKSKAENIIESRLNEIPFHKYGKIPLKFTTLKNSTSEIFFKYKDYGVVDLSLTKSDYRGNRYDLELTNKGKEYLANGYKYNGKGNYMVVYWTHTLKEVLEVHVNPSTNTAKVKVELERSRATPFGKANMEKYKTKSTLEKTYTFKKTSDGWVWNYDYPNYISN